MNKSLKLYLLVISCAVFFAMACHLPDDKKPNDAQAILESPPFAAITDSIRQFPDNADLYLRRARLLTQNNKHEIAFGDYKKTWELNPGEEAGLRYAANLSILGKTAEALNLLQDCVQKFPANMEFKRLLGEAYTVTGKPKEALNIYDNLLKKDSADFEAWYEKGLLLEEAKDTPNAIIALKNAYTIQPVNTYALELAHLYAENKNILALKICDLVISKDSANDLIDPFFIKGIYYSNTQQYIQAIAQFDSCIRRDWKFTDGYIEKGVAFFKQKNYDEALNTFRMAATVSNTYPDAYYWIGRCYEAINKKDDAITNYERAIALDRKFTEAKDALKRLKR